MDVLKIVAAGLSFIAGIVGFLYVLKDAWDDEPWKAILGFILPIYLLWYAATEFEHDYKWPILILAFGGSTIGYGILSL